MFCSLAGPLVRMIRSQVSMKSLQQPIGIERRLPILEVCQRLPHCPDRAIVNLNTLYALFFIKRPVCKRSLVDQHNLMPCLPIVGKDVFYGAEVSHIGKPGTHLFAKFTYNSIPAVFTKLDCAAEGTIKDLFLHGVISLSNKDGAVFPDNANSDWSNFSRFHYSVLILL